MKKYIIDSSSLMHFEDRFPNDIYLHYGESWRKLIITSISKIYYPILLYQTIISPSFFKHTK